MAPASHVDIDPDGDVLAILLQPLEPFAPWPSDAEDAPSAPVADDEASNSECDCTHSTCHPHYSPAAILTMQMANPRKVLRTISVPSAFPRNT
jgi:hypothetical protein